MVPSLYCERTYSTSFGAPCQVTNSTSREFLGSGALEAADEALRRSRPPCRQSATAGCSGVLSAGVDIEDLSLDSTYIKVHESANGGGKNGE